MEKIKEVDSETLAEEYLEQIKRELFISHETAESREKTLQRIVDGFEWYLKMRKLLESKNPEDRDEFLDEERQDPDKYERFNAVYGYEAGSDKPKFSTRELELFIQRVKGLSL